MRRWAARISTETETASSALAQKAARPGQQGKLRGVADNLAACGQNDLAPCHAARFDRQLAIAGCSNRNAPDPIMPAEAARFVLITLRRVRLVIERYASINYRVAACAQKCRGYRRRKILENDNVVYQPDIIISHTVRQPDHSVVRDNRSAMIACKGAAAAWI